MEMGTSSVQSTSFWAEESWELFEDLAKFCRQHEPIVIQGLDGPDMDEQGKWTAILFWGQM
jgi:hypothetical protein